MSDLSPPQQALVEFIEIDPDMLAAAAAGSAHAPQAEEADNNDARSARLDSWLDTWRREEMATMLKLITQGQGREAERQIRFRHAAWLKAQDRTSTAAALQRNVGQLRQLAQSASGVRRQREASLRLLMADVDQRWAAIDALVQRGSASGYEQAVRRLAALAEGYTLTSSRKEFDHALRRLLVRHAKRGALLRHLTDAGLWSG